MQTLYYNSKTTKKIKELPISSDIKNDGCINDIRVHHFHGFQVKVERLADQNTVIWQEGAQVSLDIRQPGRHIF